MIFPLKTYGGTGLVPAMEPEMAKTISINIAPGAYIPKGTVLGQVTGTGTAVNEQQTLTPTGTISGGTFTLTVADGSVTAPILFSATAANIQTALEAILGVGNVTVTGGPIATVACVVNFIGLCGGLDQPMLIVGNSLTGSTPVITPTQTTQGLPAGGYYKAYASGNSDGSQTAKCLNQYDIIADNYGKITFGQQQGGSDYGVKEYTGSAFYSGTFRTADLTGIDATAVGNLGRLISGQTSTLAQTTTLLRMM